MNMFDSQDNIFFHNITRSFFANDKFVKLMQDVTRDKAEKDI